MHSPDKQPEIPRYEIVRYCTFRGIQLLDRCNVHTIYNTVLIQVYTILPSLILLFVKECAVTAKNILRSRSHLGLPYP